jgi:dihydroorotate dehydrogenase
MGFYELFKFWAFRVDPEKIHDLTIKLTHRYPDMMAKLSGAHHNSDPRFALELNGMKFSFPVGLAAGLDKNAECISYFSQLPFGFIEVGTVTPKPQPGNARPRLFRYPEEESIRNCMGFNNRGANNLLTNLRAARTHGKPIGVNLGKNKDTPAEIAHQDYESLYQSFHLEADYLVINVSSPNTPGLRDLQAVEGLRAILQAVTAHRTNHSAPLFVKLAPDLALEDLDQMIDTVFGFPIEGLIATNTTIMPERGAGGMSGRVLLERSRRVRKHVLNRIKKDYPDKICIGVGGISSFQDLWDFWTDGGLLAQVYTAFIFQGPGLLYEMERQLVRALDVNKVASLRELIEHIDEAKFPS